MKPQQTLLNFYLLPEKNIDVLLHENNKQTIDNTRQDKSTRGHGRRHYSASKDGVEDDDDDDDEIAYFTVR